MLSKYFIAKVGPLIPGGVSTSDRRLYDARTFLIPISSYRRRCYLMLLMDVQYDGDGRLYLLRPGCNGTVYFPPSNSSLRNDQDEVQHLVKISVLFLYSPQDDTRYFFFFLPLLQYPEARRFNRYLLLRETTYKWTFFGFTSSETLFSQ